MLKINKTFFLIFFGMCTLFSNFVFANPIDSSILPTQENVDLKRYAGIWYEQARLPNRFQKECGDKIQADYVLLPNQQIQVINQCIGLDGNVKTAEGLGRMAKTSEPSPAKLEVRFAPAWLSWLPLVWGNYWILRLSDDYQYSLVGSPDRKYLWVLARYKKADITKVRALINYAKSLGFDTDKVFLTGAK